MAGLIPEDVKRRVREATDLVDLVRSYGVDLRRAGRNLKALCPFHQEKTSSFNVNPEGQYYKCFGCGKSGDVFSFVMDHERVEFPDALRILAQRAGIPVEVEPAALEQSKREGEWKSYLYRLNAAAAVFYREMLRAEAGRRAREYLTRRGITEESWERFGLGYAPPDWGALVARLQAQKAPVRALERAGLVGLRDDGTAYDYFHDRVMFPITDVQGRTIAFGGRILDQGEPKYLNTRETPLFTKGRTIYALHQAHEAIRAGRQAVLVEGYTDVIMCHQYGLRQVVACLGTAVTADHVRALRRVADELLVLTDSDAAGARASERSLEVLFQEDLPAQIVRLPGAAKDPCDFLLESGREAFEAALKTPQPLFEYKFQRVAGSHDLGSTAGQIAAARELMGLVSLAPDPLRRAAYRRDVAARLNLPESELKFTPVRPSERDGAVAFEKVPAPEHALAAVEREFLRWLFHQPAWIENAVGHVDLTTLAGAPERLLGKAILAAVDAGRLPPDLGALSPDTHSLSGRVAREVLGGLSTEANLFEGGKLVEEPDLARARALCVVLAEEGPVPGRLKPEELYGMLLQALRRERLEYELRDAARAVAAARAGGDAPALAEAEQRQQELQVALKRAARDAPRARAVVSR